MSARRQLFYALAVFLVALLFNEGLAEVNTDTKKLVAFDVGRFQSSRRVIKESPWKIEDDAKCWLDSINNLYENLLQREYAGPVVFPNHQVERKAQRSPSLRLRFGRSDPDMLPSAPEKRWFGDVHQKPIRSPSLRLRFGRRSDPSMPLHSNFDELLNAAAASGAAVALPNGVGVNGDYIDDDSDFNVAAFERVLRKPQRLRWGRSVMPLDGGAAAENRQAENLLEEENERQRSDDYYNALLNTEKLRSMLVALRNIDDDVRADASGEFQREVRKPGPLRLRWGRSTGGRTSTTANVAAGSDNQKDKSVEHVDNTVAEKDKNKA